MEQDLQNHQKNKVYQLNAVVKLIFILLFIVFVNLTPIRAYKAFFLYFLFLITIIFIAQIQYSIIIKRTILSLPFIIAAVPILFTGYAPYETFMIIPGIEINFSIIGVQKFISIAIKSILSIQAAVLLTITTPMPELFAAMESIKVPQLFVSVISLAYRYLFIMRDEVIRLNRARKSRSSTLLDKRRSGGSLWWRAKMAGGMLGNLFLRSIERSDRVYSAMLSRGYSRVGVQSKLYSRSLFKNELYILFVGIILILIIWTFAMLIG
ncbi:MAG: cobalt ECF transporter T component CbiQ [Anaerolineaceae bacterium]|nr:cobalt ECF transporter T component CbiQ [Anaerolineaceae bacterium]